MDVKVCYNSLSLHRFSLFTHTPPQNGHFASCTNSMVELPTLSLFAYLAIVFETFYGNQFRRFRSTDYRHYLLGYFPAQNRLFINFFPSSKAIRFSP